LTLTINQCILEGISDFAVVHDSYGVHANHTPRMAEAIRESFHKMYSSESVLDILHDNVYNVIPNIGDPPAQGSLDINGVLQSKYFFS